MGPTDGVPGRTNNGMLYGSALRYPTRCTEKLVLISDEGVNFCSNDCEQLCSTLGVDDRKTLGSDEVIKMGYYDGLYDVSNEGVPGGSLFGSTLVSTDGASMGTTDGVSDDANGGILKGTYLGEPLESSD